MPSYPKVIYASFDPKPDITREEVIRLFNGTLHTIAECAGFNIIVDDDISLDYALNFLTRLISFVWEYSNGVIGIPERMVEEYGDMMRHFHINEVFDITPL